MTIIYDLIDDAEDIINNFNPAEDVIRFKGSEFGVSTILAGGLNVGNRVSSTNTTVSDTSDIVFYNGSTGSVLDTYINTTTLQSFSIVVHRVNAGTEVRVFSVQDGLSSGTSHSKTQMARINLDSDPTIANETWTALTTTTNAIRAFEFVV
jgi:hypothetical protein